MADIHLDNNATTMVDPGVVEAMLPFFMEQYDDLDLATANSLAAAMGGTSHITRDSRCNASVILCC